MARALNANVWVDDVLYRAGETPPAEVAARIGDHAWEPEAADAAEVPPVALPAASGADGSATGSAVPDPVPASVNTEEPPRAGRGSSREAWAAHAAAHGVAVTDDMTRDDIIAAVDALTA